MTPIGIANQSLCVQPASKLHFFFLRTLQVSTFLAGLFELYFSSASFLLYFQEAKNLETKTKSLEKLSLYEKLKSSVF